jgi:hypothetical protein
MFKYLHRNFRILTLIHCLGLNPVLLFYVFSIDCHDFFSRANTITPQD